MISDPAPPRRNPFILWILFALAIHVVGFAIYGWLPHEKEQTPRGEVVSQVTIAQIERPIEHAATPAPQPKPTIAHPAPPKSSAAAPRHELARETATAPPQPPQRPHAVGDAMSRDRNNFANEVAQLNKQNDPHAIPTIDPASQSSPTKSYSFMPTTRGSSNGSGVIYPTTNWKSHGLNCYYGRYTYTYPDGAEEEGGIAWPFCYVPADDPFRLPPHPMPFPLPLPGFVLPPGTQLPPVEKRVYDEWIAAQ